MPKIKNDSTIHAKTKNNKSSSSSSSSSSLKNATINQPNDFDVICARGKLSQNHVGNCRFRVLIEMNKERYHRAQTKEEKTKIATSIVGVIRSSSSSPRGGRFLRLDAESGLMYDIGNLRAREKVSQALRETKPNELLDPESFRRKRVRNHDGSVSRIDESSSSSSSSSSSVITSCDERRRSARQKVTIDDRAVLNLLYLQMTFYNKFLKESGLDDEESSENEEDDDFEVLHEYE